MPPSASHLHLVKTGSVSDSVCVKPKTPVEKELKLITQNGSNEPFLFFLNDVEQGKHPGLKILNDTAPQRLITRQIDTPDQQLKAHGISLRIRGTLKDGQFVSPDINIKTKKGHVSASGMCRGEYECRIPDPNVINIESIEDKYRDEMPFRSDLVEALELIGKLRAQGLLQESFLIDVTRHRRVVELSDTSLGLSGDQKFIGELLNDTMKYYVRKPGADTRMEIVVPEGKSELEFELLNQACDYNPYPGCENDVCSSLSVDDENNGIEFLKALASTYSAQIDEATQSKSERGFSALNSIRDFVGVSLLDKGLLKSHFSGSAHELPATSFREENALSIRFERGILPIPMGLRAA